MDKTAFYFTLGLTNAPVNFKGTFWGKKTRWGTQQV